MRKQLLASVALVAIWYLGCYLAIVSTYFSVPPVLAFFPVLGFIAFAMLFQYWPYFALGLGILAIVRRSMTAVIVGLTVALIAPAPIVALDLAKNVKYWRAKRVVEDARPIISAIAAYKSETGTWPRQLSDLTPTYIDAIPSSAMSRYPFDYRRHDVQDTYWRAAPWELGVDIPGGFMDLDRVFYWPTKEYTYGDTMMINGWAYHHD